MAKKLDNPIKSSERIPLIARPFWYPLVGVLVGCFFWVLDAFIDVYFLEEEQSLLESIIAPDEATELWMRSLVVVVFLIMGLFSRKAILKHIKLDSLLYEYQHQLEEVVAERTYELELKTIELEKLASNDFLTGILNRRKFQELMENEFQRYKRTDIPFYLISIDLDHFKKINDAFGHDVGDMALKGVADVLVSSTRSIDIVCRWGGEEFLILIIESKDEKALKMAEKIQADLSQVEFDSVGKVTMSIGVTGIKQDDSIESLLKRADEAMYNAKEKGRNRIEVI